MSHTIEQPVEQDPRRSNSPDSARGGCTIAVQRTGAAALVRLDGELTVSALRQLDHLVLGWMIVTGARHVSVHLANADQIDAGLLQLMHDARRRLVGTLVVTAGRSEPRLSLGLSV